MNRAHSRLAVIPARGGSKRVPGKNLRPMHGIPLIAYTIQAATESDIFTRIVVTTDDPHIASIAVRFGADVPFMRDASLADDHTPVSAATLDTLERLDPEGREFQQVCQLMPNCPLRDSRDIISSLQQFEGTEALSQLSISRYGWQNPWWAMQLQSDKSLEPLFAERLSQRSQDLEDLFCPTGAVWWARSEVLRRDRSFHTQARKGWEIPWSHAVDIDTEDDWALAEMLMERRSHLPQPLRGR